MPKLVLKCRYYSRIQLDTKAQKEENIKFGINDIKWFKTSTKKLSY